MIHGCKHAILLTPAPAVSQLRTALAGRETWRQQLWPRPTSTGGHPLTDGEGLRSSRPTDALMYFYLGHETMAKIQHNGHCCKEESTLALLPNTKYNTAVFLSPFSLPKISNINGPYSAVLCCLHHLKKKQNKPKH